MMGVLIGGAGSAGSTLLRTQLNNHPQIFSGPELSLFNKSKFYTNWEDSKIALYGGSRRKATDGWFPYPSIHTGDSVYGWEPEELKKIVDSSKNLADFSSLFFEPGMKRKGAREWVEKTPSNSYCFDLFLAANKKNKVVHIVRDPYDSVASLVKRGMSHYFAAGLWVYNNSCALTVKESDRYMRVKYEDILYSPQLALGEIYRFIGVDEKETHTENIEDSNKSQKLSNWNFDPNDCIIHNNAGGYVSAKESFQQRICYALATFRISASFSKAKKLNLLSCKELCEEFGYSYRMPRKIYPVHITAQMLKDVVYRYSRMYPSRPPNYPGRLKYIFVKG